MATDRANYETVPLLATIEPTSSQRRFALGLGIGLLVAFGAVAPFAATPMTAANPVVAMVGPIVCFGDLITAVLLFSQFSIIRSRALLILGSGYLFASGLVILITLTYPSIFSTTGLLGAGLQTASWLYLTWHFGFPLAVLGYALSKDSAGATTEVSGRFAMEWSIAITLVLVCAFGFLFTAGNDFVPRLALNEITLTPLTFHLGNFITVFITAVFTLLWVRQRSVLGLWVLVAVLAFILETVMSNVLAPARYTVGFYFGVALLIFNSTVVMVILLAETTRLYAQVIRSQAALQLERQNKLISLEAVVASISHEVRQPLAAILTNAEAGTASLRSTLPDRELIAGVLHDIEDDVHRTSEVFKSIGILFGRAHQELMPVDLNGIAAEALRRMQGEMAGNGIKAQAYLAPNLPRVMGHRGQLLEVVVNLITNAIDAMRGVEGRDRLLIIESRSDGEGSAVLTVRDTGPGIDLDKSKQIFDAFFTTKSHGMGLGLAICRQIVEHHGGRISAHPPGEQGGAVFELALPTGSASQLREMRRAFGSKGQIMAMDH